jgi:hypothetical protein
MLTLGTIRFKTHSVHISLDQDSRILCFKQDSKGCSWEIFDDQWSAADYIIEPLDHSGFYLDCG